MFHHQAGSPDACQIFIANSVELLPLQELPQLPVQVSNDTRSFFLLLGRSFGMFSGYEDATLGYLEDAELLSPETFSDPRSEDGRKRGEAQRNGCLSI